MHLPKFSPALIVALVALFVSLTGTGLAATGVIITKSSQIKNGAIQIWNLSPEARAALKGQRGPVGRTGAPGAPGAAGAEGAAGPAGPAGGFDPSKLSVALSPQTYAPPYTVVTTYANCPAGSYAISGGYGTTGFVVVNGPATSPTATAWRVDVNGGTIGANFFAVAVCSAR